MFETKVSSKVSGLVERVRIDASWKSVRRIVEIVTSVVRSVNLILWEIVLSICMYFLVAIIIYR